MTHKAVIFDLDGTLLDSLQDLAEAANRSLADCGFPTHPLEAYRYFVGDGLQTLIRRILPEDARTERNMEQVQERFRQDYGRNWNVRSRLYRGIGEMLDHLATNGVAMNILSNKPHDFTGACVRHYLATWPFVQVLGNRPGIARKPDPAGALEIAASLEMEPEEIVFLGDTATDMETASRAGMYPVGALWGFRTADELRKSGAGLLIDRPAQLLDLF